MLTTDATKLDAEFPIALRAGNGYDDRMITDMEEWDEIFHPNEKSYLPCRLMHR